MLSNCAIRGYLKNARACNLFKVKIIIQSKSKLISIYEPCCLFCKDLCVKNLSLLNGNSHHSCSNEPPFLMLQNIHSIF